MALARRLLEQALRLGEVERHALAEAIGLAKVERRVGVALGGKRAPDRDRARPIALLPRLDPGPHALRFAGGASEQCRADQRAKHQFTFIMRPNLPRPVSSQR